MSWSARWTSRDTTEGAVVAMMVGPDPGGGGEHRSSATAETTLAVRGLTSGTKVIDASFELKRGEVLGIAGPHRGRPDRAAAAHRRRRPADRRSRRAQRPAHQTPARHARRHRGRASGSCRKNASATASCRSGRWSTTWPFPPWRVSRRVGFDPPAVRCRKAAERRCSPASTCAPIQLDRPDPPVQRRQPAEGDHRPLDRRPTRRSCSSTSRRAASTSGPRPRSTR